MLTGLVCSEVLWRDILRIPNISRNIKLNYNSGTIFAHFNV